VVHTDGRVKHHHTNKEKPIVVLKEYKTMGRGENSAQRYRKEIQALGVARCVAKEFNQAVEAVKDKLPADMKVGKIKFLDTKMVSYTDKPVGDGKKGKDKEHCQIFRLMEPLILGTFTKWNSNAGYTNAEDPQELPQAFSHWSFHASEGRILIADIQGVQTDNRNFQLTDPQIHCAKPTNLFVEDVTDLSLTGMRLFFKTHKCGELCKALGLREDKVDGDDLEKKLAMLCESGDEDEIQPVDSAPVDEALASLRLTPMS